ncbi:MAG: 3-hydroxyacyl-ACP dehydratase FabZ [Parachlamydiales bacterium]|jgi:3-hydroxyacyl-[acyl-carrier-protein] dehydratase
MVTAHSQLDLKEILKILPHRYPFLLVDRIIDIDLEKGIIIGQKNVTINEAFFQGHFPGAPIMPGVLILEALAQAGGIMVHLKSDQKDKIALLLNIGNAKFRKPVLPGDILRLRCEILQLSTRGGKVKAIATVEDKIAVEAEIGFVLIQPDQIGS